MLRRISYFVSLSLSLPGAMAKKRDRRVTTNPDRHNNRVKPETRVATRCSPRHLTFFLISAILVPILSLYLLYRSNTLLTTTTTTTTATTTTTTLSVYERGLVTPATNYQAILTENSRVSENSSRRHYTYPILAYVTPWNSGGYDLAKKFMSKLTHISPVWYELKSDGTQIVLEGRHNADLGWISELRRNGDALVMPRVVLEVFPNEFFRKKTLRNKAIDLVVAECREMGYDGIVLESWSRWAAYGVLHDPDKRNMALKFIKQLGKTLHIVTPEKNPENHLQLIYVIGPPRSSKLQEHDFGPDDMRSLSDVVDGFSLMTYDFSNPHSPGPNAPLKWIQATVRLLLGATESSAQNLARKIFIGINFYGNDFVLSGDHGGGAITGGDYLSLLGKHKPALQWEEKSEEHMFVYSDSQGIKHAVFYPSLMSISIRLEEARAWGAGISVWEIGQGLDYFFDLL